MKVEIAAPKKAAAPGGFAGSGDAGEPCESVFVGNLAYDVTEDAIKAAFASCGEITRIKWIEKDGEFKGTGFIDFESVEAATKAVAMAGTEIAGRAIRINFSKGKAGGSEKKGMGEKKEWGAKSTASNGRVERPYKVHPATYS